MCNNPMPFWLKRTSLSDTAPSLDLCPSPLVFLVSAIMGPTSSLVWAGGEIHYPAEPDVRMEVTEVVPMEGTPPGPLDPAPDGAPGVPDDGDAAPADEAPPPPPPAPGQGFGPRHRGRRSHTPCPCCYYTRSTTDPGTGEYSPGWRKFGGYWSWWHKGAPHAWVNGDQSLGVNDPSVPRCACCYYNFMQGVPPGPGWYVGEWSYQYGSYTWQWCGDGAPHAPGPNNLGSWDDVTDDARFMQWLELTDDGEYVPRPGVNQEDEPDEGDAVPGPAEDAPGQVAPGLVEDPDLGDSLEQAQVQSAILESILEDLPPLEDVVPAADDVPGPGAGDAPSAPGVTFLEVMPLNPLTERSTEAAEASVPGRE